MNLDPSECIECIKFEKRGWGLCSYHKKKALGKTKITQEVIDKVLEDVKKLKERKRG